jgi:hypothetical protein
MLIDEVDKADIEFPNDLLRELDRMEFHVYETQETCPRRSAPDSHHHLQQRKGTARRLPAPLLLPLHRLPGQGDDEEDRRRALSRLKKDLLREAMEVFFELREGARSEKEALHLGADRLAEAADGRGHPARGLRSQPDKKRVVPPLYGALLKNEQDVHLFERLAFMAKP